MSVNEDRLKFVLSKVAEKCGITNCQYRHGGLDECIENYFGLLIAVTLVGNNKDGEVHKNLIVKFRPNVTELRRAGVLDYLYKTEIYIYTVLIPHYKTLVKIDLNSIFPELYYADDTEGNEVIVMKNVCFDGFKRYEGGMFLDTDHMIVSLKILANIHACSIILQNEGTRLGVENNILRPYTSTYPSELMISLKNSLVNHLHLFTRTKYESFFQRTVMDFDTVVNSSSSKVRRLVFGHGDFWKENIMYMYKDNKPITACVLDFQATRLLCPAQDVLSFILTGSEAKDRRKHFQNFLSAYYDTLEQILSDHGFKTNELYSKEEFYNDLKIVASYCFVTTNMAFSLWLGLDENIIIQSKNVYDEENNKDKMISCYKQIILDIVDDLISYGYLAL